MSPFGGRREDAAEAPAGGQDRTRLLLVGGTALAVAVAAGVYFLQSPEEELPPVSSIGIGSRSPTSLPSAAASPTLTPSSTGTRPTIQRNPFGALVTSTNAAMVPASTVPAATASPAPTSAIPSVTPTPSSTAQVLLFGVTTVAADNKSSTITLNGTAHKADLYEVVEEVAMAVAYEDGECGKYFIGNLDAPVEVCEGEVKEYVVTG